VHVDLSSFGVGHKKRHDVHVLSRDKDRVRACMTCADLLNALFIYEAGGCAC
jgi:hypothetical protein